MSLFGTAADCQGSGYPVALHRWLQQFQFFALIGALSGFRHLDLDLANVRVFLVGSNALGNWLTAPPEEMFHRWHESVPHLSPCNSFKLPALAVRLGQLAFARCHRA